MITTKRMKKLGSSYATRKINYFLMDLRMSVVMIMIITIMIRRRFSKEKLDSLIAKDKKKGGRGGA